MKKLKPCLGTGRAHGRGETRATCRACNAFQNRKWRKTEQGAASLNVYNAKIKGAPAYIAKLEVFKAIRAGDLPKPSNFPCLDCGEQAEVYDHRDYSRPLEVEPVCRSCNSFRGPARRAA